MTKPDKNKNNKQNQSNKPHTKNGTPTSTPTPISPPLTWRRMKNIEEEVEALKSSYDEPRLQNLEKNMEKILKYLKEKEETDSNNNQPKTSTATISQKPQQPKAKHRYVPLAINYHGNCVASSTNYLITFSNEHKMNVNPFNVNNAILKLVGAYPISLQTFNQNSFTVSMKEEHPNLVKALTSIDNYPCKCTLHDMLNIKRGLLYIHEYDVSDLEMLRNGLQENYPEIVKLEEATFIKSRKPHTTPLIAHFKSDNLPDAIYIPGERSDTKIYPLNNRPLLCTKCWVYGHSTKKCHSPGPYCKNCSSTLHLTEKCDALLPKCKSCAGPHPNGFNVDCPAYKRELEVLQIANQKKVTIRKARQMYSGALPSKPSITFPSHFNVKFQDESVKRKFHPFLLEKCLTQQLGTKPAKIRSKDATTIIVEIKTKSQSDALQLLETLNEHPVEVTCNSQFSQSKGIIYIYNYNMSDFQEYRRGLMRLTGIEDVIKAEWIKPRVKTSVPLLVSFYDTELPSYLDIPGEQTLTKVYEQKRKPLHCTKCQKYGHSRTRCTAPQYICGRCNEEGHSRDKCTSTNLQCHQCLQPHTTASRNCQVFIFEEEIMHIQNKERISRAQAQLVLKNRQPNRDMNFSRAVKEGTTRPTTQNYNTSVNNPENTTFQLSPIPPIVEDIIHFQTQENPFTSLNNPENTTSQLSPIPPIVEDIIHFQTQENPFTSPTTTSIISFLEQDAAQEAVSSQLCSQPADTPIQEAEIVETIAEVHTTWPNAPQEKTPNSDDIFSTPPTPDHYTSENNDDIRRQTYRIYKDLTTSNIQSEEINPADEEEELYRRSLVGTSKKEEGARPKKRTSRSKSSSRPNSPNMKKYRVNPHEDHHYKDRNRSRSRYNDESNNRNRSRSRHNDKSENQNRSRSRNHDRSRSRR